MAYKRRRSMPGGPSKRRRLYARRGAAAIRAQRGARAFGRARGLKRAIKRTMLSLAESKHIFANDAQNLTLLHNQLHVIRNNIFATVQGTDHTNRIGDKIFAKYIRFKMYFENQQYRPFATYTVLVLRNKNDASANIVDGENIYEGVTTSKNIDYIDYNKYEVLYSKRIVVNSRTGPGTNDAMGSGGIDGAAWINDQMWVGQASRHHTFKVRLNKTIQYLDGTNTPSTQKFAIAVIPYSSYTTTTAGSTYPVGHVSVASCFVFKDP